MSITQDLLSGLDAYADFCRVRKKGSYITGAARFKASMYPRVLEELRRKLEPVLQNGEKIACEIREGDIVDCGMKQFRINKGTFMEVYDYSSTTAVFVRLYVVSSGDEEWLALYIDENPSTPWWSRDAETRADE